ncbi:MAG: hypothetical protein IPJ82_19720 [Lewinellaceae bacterium]|nr:hypothetical protein [Lewinellaceae bacterium]
MTAESGLSSEVGRSAKFFGMGDYAPSTAAGKDMATVASIMAKDTRVQNMLAEMGKDGEKANFGDYLYKKEHELKTNSEQETVEFVGRKYVYGFFTYLGFNTLEAFEVHLYQNAGQEAEINERPQEDDGWVYYIGAYFSVKSFGVRSFVLGINFNKPVGNKYPAKEWGFHKLSDISGSDPDSQRTDVKYDGFASIADRRWLCVQLEGNEGKNPFFLIGVVPDTLQLVKKHRVIRSILLSVSVRHYPVSAEALLIKTTREYATKAANLYEKLSPELLAPDLTKEESDILKMYIMLQRRNFYVNPDIIEDISGLKTKGSLLKNFTFLSGVYRILNFGLKRGYVIQSVMVVEPHQYRATLYPYIKKDIAVKNQNLLQQVIVFNISRIRQNKLCLVAYGEPGMSVSSYAIFDLETDNGNGFFEGCFISCGYDNRGIIGGYCVVQKVEDEANEYLHLRDMAEKSPEAAANYAADHQLEHLLDLYPREFSNAEMEKYAQKHQLQGLRIGLREIWRKKLWKQRYLPEVLKCGNRVYILKQPLECLAGYRNNIFGISCEMLKIDVWAPTRSEADTALAEAFHKRYEEQKQNNSLADLVRKVIDLD